MKTTLIIAVLGIVGFFGVQAYQINQGQKQAAVVHQEEVAAKDAAELRTVNMALEAQSELLTREKIAAVESCKSARADARAALETEKQARTDNNAPNLSLIPAKDRHIIVAAASASCR